MRFLLVSRQLIPIHVLYPVGTHFSRKSSYLVKITFLTICTLKWSIPWFWVLQENTKWWDKRSSIWHVAKDHSAIMKLLMLKISMDQQVTRVHPLPRSNYANVLTLPLSSCRELNKKQRVNSSRFDYRVFQPKSTKKGASDKIRTIVQWQSISNESKATHRIHCYRFSKPAITSKEQKPQQSCLVQKK